MKVNWITHKGFCHWCFCKHKGKRYYGFLELSVINGNLTNNLLV